MFCDTPLRDVPPTFRPLLALRSRALRLFCASMTAFADPVLASPLSRNSFRSVR